MPFHAVNRAKPARRPIEIRTVHRVLSAVACLVMLYVGVTGSAIQLLDLGAILSGKPESSAVMQSVNEGRFGNGFYSAVTMGDWGAAALPPGLDSGKAVDTTMAAFRKAKPGTIPAFVELRMVNGRAVGQVAYPDPDAPPDPRRFGTPLAASAFDVATGGQVAAMDVRGAYPPASFRQSLKQWHRFWGPGFFGTRDVPGVYVELLAGIALWVLIVTGLVMYFRLLRQRRKLKKPQLFWTTSDMWRSLHRSVSIVAAILLILVAASGTWLGFESSWATFHRHRPPPESLAITEAQAQTAIATALHLFRADQAATPIRLVRARIWFGQLEGVVVTATVPTQQHVYNVATGTEQRLDSPLYPPSPFPFGLHVHELVKHFHSGELLGLPAEFLDLLAGLSLVFLSVSGLWMYVQMWRKRASSGRKALFWK
ncbi:PepSY-associated TM helix domain-containing protein [Sphingomonas oryzagri]|uniref:PepSY-associated TM helix domain-containing protein n=1 Tax=Sphingomonas oryzagri TaxID=3042314 RepID=A0ABT6N1U7_9SPHN|nr:PepSY-associated TM helix domain-containing protein [Sphingomonas oryzagri]MDH7639255.1 PepSY-associated TM helix domain-containing protein [Sphingomonas oryzagri]